MPWSFLRNGEVKAEEGKEEPASKKSQPPNVVTGNVQRKEEKTKNVQRNDGTSEARNERKRSERGGRRELNG